MASITSDRRLQALLIAFSFGSFLEGMAGFGAPVAITAAPVGWVGVQSAVRCRALPHCQHRPRGLRVSGYPHHGSLPGDGYSRNGYLTNGRPHTPDIVGFFAFLSGSHYGGIPQNPGSMARHSRSGRFLRFFAMVCVEQDWPGPT